MSSSTGSLTFGQQINLPTSVAPGADVAAIYTGNKYFGYFPIKGDDVWLADITSPSGQPGASAALQPQHAIGWSSGILSGESVRLTAQHVTVGSYDKYLLAAGSMNDDTIRVAEINPTTGIPTEVASVAAVGQPTHVEIAQVNGSIFIISAEDSGDFRSTSTRLRRPP